VVISGLSGFGDGVVDGKKLRAKIQTIRIANNASRGRAIGNDTWSIWRSRAGIARHEPKITQEQAAIICWLAFYPFSGKLLNERIVFGKIRHNIYPLLADKWLEQVEDKAIVDLLHWILESPRPKRPQRQRFTRKRRCYCWTVLVPQ
jgi:hypothetical protein